MNRTPIEWTRTYNEDGTWEAGFTSNPIRARTKLSFDGPGQQVSVGHYCQKISPGCSRCYSSRLQRRFGLPEFQDQSLDEIKPYLDTNELQRLLKRRKPCRVFLGDMTDIFGDWVPDEWLDQICAVAVLNLDVILQLLTKRSARALAYFSHPDWWERVYQQARRMMLKNDIRQVSWDHPPRPLPNLWLGVSVESQDYEHRIVDLLQTPAAVRFVSYEPALGPLDFSKVPGFNRVGLDLSRWWVVCGGESGPKARPIHPDWARSARDQCVAAGVPFFFKQWGAWTPGENVEGSAKHETVTVDVDTGEFGTCADDWITEADDGPILYRVGKKAAGHLLDGKEWREFPEVTK